MADLSSIQVSSTPTNPGSSGNRGLIIGLIAATLLAFTLIVAGAGLLAFSLLQRPSSIPQLLGADTQIYVTLTPNLSDLPNIQRLQQSYPEVFDAQDSPDANAQLEELLGVNFEQDVAPWIGTEVAFAVTGLQNAPVSELLGSASAADDVFAEIEQGLSHDGNLVPDDAPDAHSAAATAFANDVRVMIVLASRDADLARAFLDKQRASRIDQGEQFAEITHNGVTMYEQTIDTFSGIKAFALVKDHVVFANQIDVIQAMIDRDGGGADTLAANPRFEDIRNGLPADAVAYAFVDLQALAGVGRSAIEEQLESLPTSNMVQIREAMAALDAAQGLGLSMSIVAEGLHFDMAMTMDQAKLTPELRAQLDEVRQGVAAAGLDRISADALALMTFHIPASFKDRFIEQIESVPDGPQQLAMFEQQFGFDLEQDLLNWLHGDGAIVLLPGETIADFTSPVTLYFALTPRDKAAAEAGMANIATAINGLMMGSGMELEAGSIDNQNWQLLKNPQTGEALAGYGFVGDDLVIGLGNTALRSAAGGSSNPISADADFQAVYNNLARPNSGVFYVAVGKAVDSYRAADIDPGFAGSEAEQGLEPLRAIGAAGDPGVNEQGLARARLVIHLK